MKKMCREMFGLAALALIAGELATAAPPTAIIRDGSLGPVGTVSATSPGFYAITPSMGKTVGSNIFQSFGTFNLGTGDTADFVANAGTQNIIARVTGGSASSIDGTITSTVGVNGPLSGANLFLINPAGIMFTANASLNLNGAFVASTANDAKLGSAGVIFYADTVHPVSDAGLTSMPISAFGFLPAAGQVPAPVKFLGAQLNNPGGLDVVGGDITLNQSASLLAPGGKMTLFSAAGAGELPFAVGSPGAGVANATNKKFGTITLVNNSSIAIDSTQGGGSLVIRGGKIVVTHSTIEAINEGANTGGNISIEAVSLTLQNAANIATSAFATGKAGNVGMVIGSASLSGGSAIFSATQSGATGNAGQVNIACSGDIDLTGLSSISDGSDSTGNGGGVNIGAKNILVTDNSVISAVTFGSGSSEGINLDVRGVLRIDDGGELTFGSFGQAGAGSGNARGPVIEAGNLLIGGSRLTGIFGEGLGAGNISSLDIIVGFKLVMNGGTISTAAFGSGNAGEIVIQTGSASLNAASIDASASGGHAGAVVVRADGPLDITGGTSIETVAQNLGGGVFLYSNTVAYLLDSEIATFAGMRGGNILASSPVTVFNGDLILADSAGGVGGNITQEGGILMQNDSIIEATGVITITSPDVDLSGSLAPLPTGLETDENRLRESCARSVNHEFSSLIVVGRNGTETAPDELQPDFGLGR